jgi:virulence-associated protein VagC
VYHRKLTDGAFSCYFEKEPPYNQGRQGIPRRTQPSHLHPEAFHVNTAEVFIEKSGDKLVIQPKSHKKWGSFLVPSHNQWINQKTL